MAMEAYTSNDGRLAEVSGSEDHGSATVSCAFFIVLPPELRRQILIAAFGGQKMHLQSVSSMYHASDIFKPSRPPAQKRLGGCVCHRIDANSAANDNCMRYPVNHPLWRPIGALGWLLSCHQACHEGLEVLYATNTIHFRIETLDFSITDYIGSPHMSRITSLELVFDWRFLTLPKLEADEQEHLERLIHRIPIEFPELRRLCIVFSAGLPLWPSYATSPKESLRIYNEHVLPPIDDMFRDLGGHLNELELGLPLSAFQAHYFKGIFQGLKFQVPGWEPENIPPGFPNGGFHARERIWRPVQSPKSQDEVGCGTERGYWISEAGNDMPPNSWNTPQYWE